MATLSFMEPLRARFGGLVADMSPRDRALFLGLVLVGYGGAIFMAFWLGNGFLGELDSRIEAREDALARLQDLEGTYVQNAAKVNEIEAELRRNGNQDFQAYVEKAAAKVGISANLKSVREKGVSEIGTLQEKTYTVEVDRVSLQAMTDFLHEVETGGFPLRIHTSRIKSSGTAGQKVVSGSLELSAYRLIESAPLAEPTMEINP